MYIKRKRGVQAPFPFTRTSRSRFAASFLLPLTSLILQQGGSVHLESRSLRSLHSSVCLCHYFLRCRITDPITCMCYVSPNSLLACGTSSGQVIILDPVNKFCEVDRLNSQAAAITCLHAIPVRPIISAHCAGSAPARGRQPECADLSLGRPLLFHLQFPRFADPAKHFARTSGRCDRARLYCERRVSLLGRTRPLHSAVEHGHRPAGSLGGGLTEPPVGRFLEFQK